MGDQDLQLREGLGRVLILPTKKLSPPFSFMPHSIPNSIPPLIPVVHIFRFTIITYLKKLIGIKGLLTNNFRHA